MSFNCPTKFLHICWVAQTLNTIESMELTILDRAYGIIFCVRQEAGQVCEVANA